MAFTIVFEGSIRDLSSNPMKIESPFGKPIASGMGNAFDEALEALLAVEDIEYSALIRMASFLERRGWICKQPPLMRPR